MKFKVGDKIKVRKGLIVGRGYGDWYFCSSMEQWKGKIMTIREVRSDSYKVEENNWGWSEEMLERAGYTYEDLKKSPIGTKAIFANGIVLIKLDGGYYRENRQAGCHRSFYDLRELKDNFGTGGKIVKIEEPEYRTVYEYKPEILDEAEKRYLRGVIRPFKDSVEVIIRRYSQTKNKDYIQIRYKNDNPTNLPYFEKDTMYKGMELDKIYTLEELGL